MVKLNVVNNNKEIHAKPELEDWVCVIPLGWVGFVLNYFD